MMKVWLNSVYSDSTKYFVNNPYPQKNETIDIQIRMLENDEVKHVLLRAREFGIERLTEMYLDTKKNGLVYYKTEIKVEEDVFHYQFYIITEEKVYYYSQHRITDYIPDETRDFVLLTKFKPANWVQKSVFYQIFPDRFCNGNQSLSVKSGEFSYQGYEAIQVADWNKPVRSYLETRNLDFYGGDLEGIILRLDYLQSLGVNAIYLNPIFLSPSVHKYDSIDYLSIDPHFGGDKALARLSEEIHHRGMKLMLDISINHTSSAARWFNKDNEFFDVTVGAYQNTDSKEREYYFFGEENAYDTWNGVETMPKLNFTSQELRNIIYRDNESVLKKWILKPYNIDGWRFDVADCLARNNRVDVHNEVLEEIREELKNVKDSVYLLAEDWADCSEDLQGNRWDGTMNYFGCARPIREFVGERDLFNGRNELLRKVKSKLTAKQLSARITQFYGRMPSAIQYQMLNLLDSHDVSRLYNNTAVHPEEYKGAVMLMFALPGSPNVYYGDEISLTGQIDEVEYCRNPMDWQWEKKEKARESFAFYQKLIQLKTSSDALKDGGFQIVSDEHYVISVVRFTTEDIIFVICSTDSKEREVTLPIQNYGVTFFEEDKDYFRTKMKMKKGEGTIAITVPPHQSYLLRIQNKNTE